MTRGRCVDEMIRLGIHILIIFMYIYIFFFQFDKDLCMAYAPYQRVRKLKKLAPMKIIEVEPGTFQNLRSIISMDNNAPPRSTPKILRTTKYLEFLLGQSKASFDWSKKTDRKY